MFARWVLASLFVASCSQAASSPDETPPPTTVKASDYCEKTADFFCDFYLRCGRIVAADPAECRATFLETCNARYEPRYVDLEAAGLLSLSASGIDACRAHLETVACAKQANDLAGPCATMWVGTQPEGAACGLDVESFTCAPGTACVVTLDLCGTCKAVLPAGSACGDTGTCGPDASCVDSVCVTRALPGDACSASKPCTVGASCANGVCVSPAVVGEGEACDATHRCAYRSACIGKKCVRAALLGEDCAGRTCASGRCVADASGTVCQPLLEPGSACKNALECRSASCVKGVCEPLPDACFP